MKKWKQKENKHRICLIIQKRYGEMMLRLMLFVSFWLYFQMLLMFPNLQVVFTCSIVHENCVCHSLSLIQGSNSTASSKEFFSACLTMTAKTCFWKSINFLKICFCLGFFLEGDGFFFFNLYGILIWLDQCQAGLFNQLWCGFFLLSFHPSF